jgi:hypothetical protein
VTVPQTSFAPPVVHKRIGGSRERHGRGLRGPVALPGPLSPRGLAVGRSRRDDFDDLVLLLVDRLASRWEKELAGVEFGTEDAPQIPDDWTSERVPFGSLVPAGSRRPARIVVFRRPIEMRAKTRPERTALVHEVLVEHIAALLGRDPAEVDF